MMLSALGHIGIEKDQSPEGKSFKEGSNPSCSNRKKGKEIAMINYKKILLVSVLISSMVLILIGCKRRNAESEVLHNIAIESTSPTLDNEEYQAIVDEVALHHERYQKEYDQFIEDNKVFLSDYEEAICAAYDEAEYAVIMAFNVYKERIPAFAKELTKFSNTAGLFWNSILDKFLEDKTHVESQIRDTFEKTVFDEDTLSAELNAVVYSLQVSINIARETYWKNVASYLDKATTFSPIDLKSMHEEIPFAEVSAVHTILGNEVGETAFTTVTVGGASLAILTVTTGFQVL